ncbi:MAG: hypothetical protein ACRDD3_05630 [Azovibrio sp.]
MKRIFHSLAGGLALCFILAFWSSTVVSELLFSPAAVLTVKTMVLYGMLCLIPLMIMAGGSGFSLAGRHSGKLLIKKKKRMQILGANGLLVLAPAAFFLFHKASAGEFDSLFYGIQVVELVAGLIQITLMVLNMRDGFKLTGRFVPIQNMG